MRRVRLFHFGTPSYHACFLPAVPVEASAIRAAAVAALGRKDADQWYREPIVSLLHGVALKGGTRVNTIDAFGAVNGSQLLASDTELERLVEHAATFRPARADLRAAVRRAEATMLTKHAGELIANQTLDFGKQDGVTEIEESLQANEVERRLNDQLWETEEAGVISVPRRVALVPCVSNFSHFLDMCRKTIRLIEIGVPAMVLSRTHTQQYCYRWAALLAQELQAEGVDPAYFSFCSATVEQQQRVMKAADAADAAAGLPAGLFAPTPCLFTGARALAKRIKTTVSPGLIASTQGPNMMVALGLTPSIATAAALSATIEHSGQCTALRVLVAPAGDVSPAALESMFDSTPSGGRAQEFLATGTFAGVLDPAPSPSPLAGKLSATFTPPAGYTAHATKPIAYKTRPTLPDLPPPAGSSTAATYVPEPPLEEYWRQVVLDVVTPANAVDSAEVIERVGAWLVRHQPISLAVNGTTDDAVHASCSAALSTTDESAAAALALERLPHLRVARRLFETSALCVYSVGDASRPCLTAQARPQDGEIFGELPPLGEMNEVTTFPVIGPAPNSVFFASYRPEYLRQQASRHGLVGRAATSKPASSSSSSAAATVKAIVEAASSAETRGYLLELANYLQSAAVGPRRCVGKRTGLYGLQCPPLNGKLTALRCAELTTLDELLPFALVFAMTNAAPQAMLSIDPANDVLLDELPRLQLKAPGIAELVLVLHTEDLFASAQVQAGLARTLRPTELSEIHRFPLAHSFVTRMMPPGHIKSSRSDDLPFYAALEASPKWLRIAAAA